MNPVQHYQKLSGDTLFRKFVRKLAFRAGYICVPSDYPLWLNKTASICHTTAMINEAHAYQSGVYTGRSNAFNVTAEEIRQFSEL